MQTRAKLIPSIEEKATMNAEEVQLRISAWAAANIISQS
jgi:hypothetical protein